MTSLYKLYRPTGTPQLQIVFFHGLQLDSYTDAHLSAWKSEDGSCVWPQKWLTEDFPGAHVLSVSYSAAIERRSQGSMDMFTIGENLVSDLMECDIGQIPFCPVILVGHSFGGLVIKQVCSQAHHSLTKLSEGREREKLQRFLDNVGGIFFYATPHHGSDHAKKLTNKISDPLLPFFNTFSVAGARLNQEFNDISALHDRWRTAGLGEGRPTLLAGNWGPDEEVMIVPEASARVSNFNMMEKDDHFSISKPKGKNFRNFSKLKDFVADINSDAKHVHQCQGLPCHGVDLQSRALAVQKKLEAPKVLGIVGMGGIGKTTLAKTVFNLISRDFEYTCFVENVKGIPPHELEKLVLTSFYKHGTQIDASQFSWRDLERKKALFALDDVDSELQLKNLGELKDFGDGSRVIISTRNENIFSCLERYHVYKVDFLESEEAEKMFCKYAELKEVPDSLAWRESKVKVVVEKCGGLPLTLEVLGCYLRGHVDDPKFWEETIWKLGQAESMAGNNKDRLWESLRVSYNGLAQKEQEMFIEAAIYFFEQPLDRALASWSGSYKGANTSCENLISRSMMKVLLSKNIYGVEEKTVWVHEQLRDLAARIAKKNYVVSRYIENIREMKEAVDFLNSDEVDGNTKIVRVENRTFMNYTFKLDFLLLDKLSELKCLEVRWVIPAGRLKKFPRNLSLLRWETGEYSPPLFPQIGLNELSNLGVLELEGWEVPKEFPEALGNLTNLRILSLSRLRGLHHLPENLGNLSQLKQLTLSQLDLPRLPESLGDLVLLEELKLDELDQLKCLPGSFCRFQSLRKLQIWSHSLETLPDSLGQLASLQHLDIYCSGLTALPDTLGDLVQLVELHLYIGKVKALPKTLGRLVRLVCLLLWAEELEALPNSLGQLVHLEDLFLDVPRVKDLEAIGQLSALQSLRIWGSGVVSLPHTFGEFSSLRTICLANCPNLKKLPDSFGNICALERLVIGLDNLQELPENLGGLTHLQSVEIRSKCLTSLPTNMGQLSLLSNLEIFCPSLTTVPDSLGNLSSLQFLHLKAAKLESIPESIGRLRSLTKLTIHSKSLRILPSSFGELSVLKEVELHCDSLESLPDELGDLSSLRELDIRASSLMSLPESITQLSLLRRLVIQKNSLDRFQEQRLALLGWRLVREERSSPLRRLWNSLLPCLRPACIRSDSHAGSHTLLKFERNSS